jgi:glycolate dehydrogenase iron-sulfur subunit
MRLRRDHRESNAQSFVQHIDTCLGCMACVTACPSGVQYDSLLEAARPEVERVADRSVGDRAFRGMIFALFPYPARLRLLAWPMAIYQKSGLQRLVHASGLLSLLPKRLRAMERLLPPISLTALRQHAAEHVPAEGVARRRVALLTGCVQRVFFSGVNAATMRVLAAEGCEVFAPAEQGCCGALAEHAGEQAQAVAAAKQLIDVFSRLDVDTIVINAAGCGSAMKRYGHLLRDDPEYAARAREFAAKCRDIAEVLGELEPRAVRGRVDARVAYHDACHLQHAQGVRAAPRQLLRAIPGVELNEVPESEICCGSAGIYNLLEPDAATQLRDRKVRNILSTKPDVLVSSNPGCLLQISTGFEEGGASVPVMHLVELLDRSISQGRRS